MNILVLNCGSSSLKFQMIETDLDLIEKDKDRQKAKGLIERIGQDSIVNLQVEGKPSIKRAMPLHDHRAALDFLINWLISAEADIPGIKSLNDIHAIGHRMVHGAEKFNKSIIITEEVVKQVEACIDLAPLHNPANLKGIYAATEVFGPNVPQVGVFDTSFHSTMKEEAFLYAIPYQFYEHHRIRRYGFHGTSIRYVAYRYRQLTGKSVDKTNIIVLHLGNGCSACAIQKGESINTSMGMTPLEGLVMGTRGGDLDPGVIEFLATKAGMSVTEIFTTLNKKSGLMGLSGITNDMRDLVDKANNHNDARAKLAIDIFCLRVKKYIGAYFAQMNGADAIVFTGGIGENAAEIRELVCANMDALGIDLDLEKNKKMKQGAEGEIGKPDSKIKIFVVPTNEELLIARDTVRCVKNTPRKW